MLIGGFALSLATRLAVQLASRQGLWVCCSELRLPCFTLQLPIEDLCSLSSRSLQSPFTATVPASTEDVLRKGFQMLDMENDRIETAQQVTVASVNGNFNAATRVFCSKQYAWVK